MSLTVLCFDCGGSYKVPQGTPNPTQHCPRCDKGVKHEDTRLVPQN